MAKDNRSQLEQGDRSPTFGIQRVYVEDVSFEIPSAPVIFKQDWQPDVKLNLNTEHHKLDDAHYRVVLTVHITVKLKDKVAFIVEVKQAGIFALQFFTDQQRLPLLGAYCPSILFPYAREMVANLVGHGGFPPLHLAPINFDALYEQKMKENQSKQVSE